MANWDNKLMVAAVIDVQKQYSQQAVSCYSGDVLPLFVGSMNLRWTIIMYCTLKGTVCSNLCFMQSLFQSAKQL